MIKKIKKKVILSQIIDLFILIVIGFVFFFLIFFLRRKQELITFKLKVTDRDVLFSNVNPWNSYVQAFSEGDTERNELGKVVAEIQKVFTIEENPHKQSVYLEIKLKATYNPRSKKYSFRSRPIIYGQPFIFEFSNVKVEGIVVDFPGFLDGSSIKKYKKLIRVQVIEEERSFSDVYGIRDFKANGVNIGDEIIDSDGEVLIKVVDREIYPAKRTIFTDSGRSYVASDLQLKDVFLTLEVQVKEINGRAYVLDFVPLYLGGVLPLNFENISLWPTIIEIQDE